VYCSFGFVINQRLKRGPYKQYSDSDLMEAARLVADGTLKLEVAVALYGYNLPKSTIADRAQGLKEGRTEFGKAGHPTTLSSADEEWLAAWCKLLYQLGVPVSRAQLLRKARDIAAIRGTKFNGPHGLPGDNWWRAFCRRQVICAVAGLFLEAERKCSLCRA
jgi:hypothetical protein